MTKIMSNVHCGVFQDENITYLVISSNDIVLLHVTDICEAIKYAEWYENMKGRNHENRL